jgi:DNA-binding CsgD family transcriptional regulator
VILLHGFCLDQSSRDIQIGQLIPEWGNDIRIISYDHRGHGDSAGARALRPLHPGTRTQRFHDRSSMTGQEAHIARMARDAPSNPEIGTRLFLSARTVRYHLKKVFIKLGIESRTQLDRVLSDRPTAAVRLTGQLHCALADVSAAPGG